MAQVREITSRSFEDTNAAAGAHSRYESSSTLEINRVQNDDDYDSTVTYNIAAVELQRNLPRAKQEIPVPVIPGVMSIVFYVDPETWEAGIEVDILGHRMSGIYGNIKDGLVINVSQLVYQGTIKFNYEKKNAANYVTIKINLTGVLPAIKKEYEVKLPF